MKGYNHITVSPRCEIMNITIHENYYTKQGSRCKEKGQMSEIRERCPPPCPRQRGTKRGKVKEQILSFHVLRWRRCHVVTEVDKGQGAIVGILYKYEKLS